MFVWVTLPDFIDTTDLLARALRDNVAFVPGAGAFLDGRGSDSMRLNFSASSEDRTREGIRRIGKVISEQMELYGTLTGEMTAISTEELEIARQEDDADEGARVIELRRRAEGA
jgi:2-aminoadipate transaminase